MSLPLYLHHLVRFQSNVLVNMTFWLAPYGQVSAPLLGAGFALYVAEEGRRGCSWCDPRLSVVTVLSDVDEKSVRGIVRIV